MKKDYVGTVSNVWNSRHFKKMCCEENAKLYEDLARQKEVRCFSSIVCCSHVVYVLIHNVMFRFVIRREKKEISQPPILLCLMK